MLQVDCSVAVNGYRAFVDVEFAVYPAFTEAPAPLVLTVPFTVSFAPFCRMSLALSAVRSRITPSGTTMALLTTASAVSVTMLPSIFVLFTPPK
jgi:hypothetical protein